MKVPVELLTLLGLAANRITAGGWPLPHSAFESREAEGIIRGTHFVPSALGGRAVWEFHFQPSIPPQPWTAGVGAEPVGRAWHPSFL